MIFALKKTGSVDDNDKIVKILSRTPNRTGQES